MSFALYPAANSDPAKDPLEVPTILLYSITELSSSASINPECLANARNPELKITSVFGFLGEVCCIIGN